MRAFVIGNIAIDETIAVMSMPEAGASILGREETRDLGGKGANQAIVLGRAGLAVTLVTAVGEDFRASLVREQIADEPVTARLVTLPERATDFSIIFTTPDGENAIVTTTECAEALPLRAGLDALKEAKRGDLVVLQGNLSEDATRGILSAAREMGLVTALNPSPLRPYFPQLWPLVDMVFINRGEAEYLAGSAQAEAAANLVAAGAGCVVMTLGGAGAVLIRGEGMETIPAAAASVVDTTGAGDTFMAVALASCALRGVALDARAIADAAAAAALTVSRRGTRAAFPSSAELRRILSR